MLLRVLYVWISTRIHIYIFSKLLTLKQAYIHMHIQPTYTGAYVHVL